MYSKTKTYTITQVSSKTQEDQKSFLHGLFRSSSILTVLCLSAKGINGPRCEHWVRGPHLDNFEDAVVLVFNEGDVLTKLSDNI